MVLKVSPKPLAKPSRSGVGSKLCFLAIVVASTRYAGALVECRPGSGGRRDARRLGHHQVEWRCREARPQPGFLFVELVEFFVSPARAALEHHAADDDEQGQG